MSISNKKVYSPGTKDSDLKFVAFDWTTEAAVDSVKTGLKNVFQVFVQKNDDPVDGFADVSAKPDASVPGNVTIKSWQNTGGTDPTPAAAAAFSKKVSVLVIGS